MSGAASSTPAAASQMLEFQLDDGLNTGPDSEGESEPDIPNSWPPATPTQLHGGGPYSTPIHQHVPSSFAPAYYWPHAVPYYPETPANIHGPPTTYSPAPDLQTTMALDFIGHLFNDTVPDFPSGSQRIQFQWPQCLDVVIEDRILVVIHAIKKTGFPALRAFLAALFSDSKYNKHATVYHTIAALLSGQENLVEHHPIAIIELIFHHRKSQEYVDGVPLEPNFALPCYALPPSNSFIIFRGRRGITVAVYKDDRTTCGATSISISRGHGDCRSLHGELPASRVKFLRRDRALIVQNRVTGPPDTLFHWLVNAMTSKPPRLSSVEEKGLLDAGREISSVLRRVAL
ncbi:hypothetical protein DFH08DRAFT_1000125 [Mycena albidolilacea]|uniref:Uncharacterized protein n=1 Tax=Mycena albidolilacea TaxID=1033008 RepID=A0AAD7A2U6_9AGAR|nr:hypothetical protein DFH08DRAFT_1000125 [Mycena albidolilacea]